jgi:ligand-binding sensor domain-containing protein
VFSQRFPVPEALRKSAAISAVAAIHEDPKGRVWLGTWGGLLACFDGGEVRDHSRVDGVRVDAVGQIVSEPDGVVWIGTYDGLFRDRERGPRASAHPAEG